LSLGYKSGTHSAGRAMLVCFNIIACNNTYISLFINGLSYIQRAGELPARAVLKPLYPAVSPTREFLMNFHKYFC
jgi:hypothetical protein